MKCKEKIQAVGCHGDDSDVVVLLLSEGGRVFFVDTHAYNPKYAQPEDLMLNRCALNWQENLFLSRKISK